MKHYEFNYSKDFSCIAGNCKHNCCIGWKIDIDKKSLARYETLKEKDARFNESSFSNGSFKLNDFSRCPFLDGDNLCHIIKNYGEKNLCKTCKTHPRFKNFFTGVTETGLGLYCEEACKIILSSKNKMKLKLIKDDGKAPCLSVFEKKVVKFRKNVITILQNRKISINDRLLTLKNLCGIDLNKKSFLDWIKVFLQFRKIKYKRVFFCGYS